MSTYDQLQTIFQSYLAALPARRDADVLGQVLREAGLQDEANALAVYDPNTDESMYTWQRGVWSGKRCFVSAHMPQSALPGDLWLDVVELTPHVLVPNLARYSEDVKAWLALHPVWMWQFRAFLNSVSWRKRNSGLIVVTDLMDLQRFDSIPGESFVDNLYHEEAVAYARWFGKGLCDRANLESAREFLPVEQFDQLLPINFRLWQVADPFSEDVREAYGADTLDKSLEAQLIEYRAEEIELSADSTIFSEWHRRANLGLSTQVSARLGLFPRNPPRKAYEFVELLNLAYRPLK